MTITSFLFALFAAFILAILGMLYVRSVHKNTLARRLKRKELIRKVEHLRLHRMMKALGVGLGSYFYRVPLKEIEKNIAGCESCSSTDLCDEKLKIPELNPGDVEFCPSLEQLEPFSRESRIKN